MTDCRGQGCDNGSDMSGSYNRAQSHLLALNHLAKFSPCARHSLKLCGVQAVECCPEVQKFFGVVQQFYNFFSCSPQGWVVLQEDIGCSLHSTSDTRWIVRVDSVRPIVEHLNKRNCCLELLRQLELDTVNASNTAKCTTLCEII